MKGKSDPPLQPRWVIAGPLLFLLAACLYGVLEVHYSDDTWIGLASGRQIMESAHFPTTDQFSYTFTGRPWFNPNWLSHVFLWELYHKLGPAAAVWGNWLVAAGIFLLVLLAVRVRSGSTLAAVLAAALTALACRDWLSIRPATIQFFLLAALWLCLSALSAPGAARRWWAVILVFPILGFWSHAHGSFLFGFGMLGLFLASALAARLLRRPPPVSDRQLLALAGLGILAALQAVVLSPYGAENLLHPFKVVESPVFRTIGEWIPPYRHGRFPGVLRCWIVLGVAAAAPLLILLLRSLEGSARGSKTPGAGGARAILTGPGTQVLLFDLAAVAAGLGMAMFARRFAPVFYILSAPALVSRVLHLSGTLSFRMRSRLRTALLTGSAGASVAVGALTISQAYRDLAHEVPARGGATLLDRVTQEQRTPMPLIRFLGENHLPARVFTEWKLAAPLIFYAPETRVFIDARSQQVYSEEQFMEYNWLIEAPEGDGEKALQVLDQAGTDAVLLPRWESVQRLANLILRAPRWIEVLSTSQGTLWARKDSALLKDLGERERTGRLSWPEAPSAFYARAMLLAGLNPPETGRAVELWKEGVSRDPLLALRSYGRITAGLIRLGRAAEAADYLRSEEARLGGPMTTLAPGMRGRLRDELARCRTLLQNPGASPPPVSRTD